MYGSVLLAAGLGYYLFVYKGVDRTQQPQQSVHPVAHEYPTTRADALKYYLQAKLPWGTSLGEMYVYARSFPQNELPTEESREALVKRFKQNVNRLREAGELPKTPLRYIDKVDLSLELTTVRVMYPDDVVSLYKRQMRYLAMFTRQANPFETLRQLVEKSSLYGRPSGPTVQSPERFSGTFALFLQDYYFSQYLPTRNEWHIYVAQQQRNLDEVEHDIFTFLNGGADQPVTNQAGKVVVTCFSTVGLELIANLLKPDRTIVPQLEVYERAFDDGIWQNYFPYTWAEVNRKEASVALQQWAKRLK